MAAENCWKQVKILAQNIRSKTVTTRRSLQTVSVENKRS